MENNIKFIDTDAQNINDKLINDFEAAYGGILYPGDERRIFLQQLTQIIVGLKNDINDSALQNLLRYARGSILDALGEFSNTSRLQAQKSSVTLKFTLSSAQSSPITIPKGTKVTVDGEIYFETGLNLLIPSGQTVGEVKAEAIEVGTKYNNFSPGQIKNIVNPIPYVSSVTNTDTSSGGTDIEDDDHYRERIRQAPESFSTAGPEGAYIFWAKTADVNISDVSVSSPSPGVVKIVPLMDGGVIPTQVILDKVKNAVSAKDKRPLTDNVQVVPPTQIPYNIDLTYYISNLNQTEEANIKRAIEDTGGAIEQYKLWQSEKLGRAINPDELRFRMMKEGASRIILNSPSYRVLNEIEVASIGTVNIVYGGLE